MPRNSSALISSPEIVSPIAFEMSAKFFDTPPNTDEIIPPIDSMADSIPKNSTHEPTNSPIAPPACESASPIMLATREIVSPMAPMLFVIAFSGLNDASHS